MSFLKRQFFGSRDVVLAELCTWEEPRIKGIVFEECKILGPALIIPDSSTKFKECGFAFQESAEELFWELAPSSIKSGAIEVNDCRFRKCEFWGVGIVGPKSYIDRFRKWIPGG